MNKQDLERANEIQVRLANLELLKTTLEPPQGFMKVDKVQLESAILTLIDPDAIEHIVSSINKYIDSETEKLNEEFKNL